MSEPVAIGKTITESIRFVSRVGAECNGLLKLIKEELSQALLGPELRSRYKANGEWADVWENDELEWVIVGAGSSLPLTLKPKRSTGGHLVAQISLTGQGIAVQNNDEPLLHIGWWGNPLDFDEVVMGFPVCLESGYEVRLEDKQLIRWSHSQWPEEWCFSIPLADMNSPVDVQRNVVKPVVALLLGHSAESALAGSATVQYQYFEASGDFRVLPAL